MDTKELNNKQQILIYKTKTGEYSVDVLLEGNNIWLTQKQMAGLFEIEPHTINYHLKNIFKNKELKEKTVARNFRITARDGKSYKTNFYNLDAIISVGYRVNSARATQFRIWATKTLKDHLLQGYTINQKRIAEVGVKELETALKFIKQASSRHQITNEEVQGLLDVITKYAKSWLLLKSYDEDSLPIIKGKLPKFILNYKHAQEAIKKLKKALIDKGEASEIFGFEREYGLDAILGNLEQSFGGQDLYSTIENKAAHLLYFIIKDHPFSDGNKRIGSLLFIYYLDKNNHLHKTNGELLINDNTLVALALLIAESDPKSKDLMIELIKNLLVEKD